MQFNSTWLASLRNAVFAFTLGMVSLSCMATNEIRVSNEIRCIADNVYFEARGEGREGWDAILTVMHARVNDKRFPSTYCGVVKQKRRNTCQFSWVCNPNLRKKTSHRNTKLYKEILDYAITFYQSPSYFINKDIEGSLFYHNNKVKRTALGKVKVGKTVKIGNHYFYKNHKDKPL